MELSQTRKSIFFRLGKEDKANTFHLCRENVVTEGLSLHGYRQIKC